MSPLGRRVRQLRLALGLTQDEVAQRSSCKLTRSWVSALEIGAVDQPAAEKLITLAGILEVDPDELHRAAGYIPTPKNGTRPDEDDESLSTFLKSVPLHDKKRLSSLLKRLDEMIDADIESVEKTGHGI